MYRAVAIHSGAAANKGASRELLGNVKGTLCRAVFDRDDVSQMVNIAWDMLSKTTSTCTPPGVMDRGAQANLNRIRYEHN